MEKQRVAIISDIHSNIYALKVFIDYLNERPEIKTVLNLGDFLQYGPKPVEVFDTVMDDPRFINVLGNNEIDLFYDLTNEEDSDRVKHIKWTKDELGQQRMDRLKQVPKSQVVEFQGNKFMLIHTVMEEYVDLDELKLCEYVLMGHTHQQSFGSYWKEIRVVNPGSIGYTPKGVINFAVMDIQEDTINFVFKNMHYDFEELKQQLEVTTMPGAKKIMKYLMQGE